MALTVSVAKTLGQEELIVVSLGDNESANSVVLVSEEDEVGNARLACNLAAKRLTLVAKAFKLLAKEKQITQESTQEKMSEWLQGQIEETHVN